MERQQSLLSVILASTIALLAAPAAPRPADSPKAVTEKKGGAPGSGSVTHKDTAERLLDDHFAIAARKEWQEGDQLFPPEKTPTPWHASAPTGIQVSVFVATVPDPLESQLAISFDRFLEAIRRSMEAQGYVLDRFHLPWVEERDGTARAVLGWEEQDKRDNRGRARRGSIERRRHGEEPGVLLFHRAADEKQEENLALFYLVGETPTSGISQGSLRASLTSADAIPFERWEEPKGQLQESSPSVTGQRVLRILGPTFSGSTRSLRRGLQTWLATERKHDYFFTVVSGSATDEDNRASLESNFPARFAATVHPDRLLLETFVEEYVGGMERAAPLAILHEANTVYGAGVVSGSAFGANRRHVIDVPFSMHLAKLRGEYERVRREGDRSVTRVAGTGLDVSLSGPEGTADTLPTLAPLSAPTDDLNLRQQLAVLADRNVRWIVIAATDPADVLFLASRIHESCPNAVIVLLSGDVLYAHGRESLALNGAIVVSSYPLLTDTQQWFRGVGHPPLVPFGDTATQGTYNAVQLLCGADEPVDYFARDGAASPAIWLSTPAGGRLWPLRRFVIDEKKHRVLRRDATSGGPNGVPGSEASEWRPYVFRIRAESTPTTARVPRQGRIALLAFLSSFAALAMALVVGRSIWNERGAWFDLWRPPMAECTGEDHATALRRYRWAIGGAFFGALLVQTTVAAVDTWMPVPLDAPLPVALGHYAVLACTGVLAGVGVARCANFDRRRLVIAAELGTVLLLLAGIPWTRRTVTFDDQLDYLRLSAVGSKASPLLAVVALGFIVVLTCVARLRTERLLQEGVLAEDPTGRHWETRTLEKLRAGALSQRGAVAVGLLLLGVLTLQIGQRFAPAIDGKGITVALLVLLAFCVLLTLTAFVRVWQVWGLLREHLHEEEAGELAPAYGRLPDALRRTVWNFLDAPPRFTALRIAVDQSEKLRMGSAELPPVEVDIAVTEAREELRDALERHARHEAGTECARFAVRQRLHIFEDWIRPRVLTYWRTRAVPASPSEPATRAEQPGNHCAAWFSAAETFLAVREVAAIHHVIAHLRIGLGIVLLNALLMLLAISSYPLPPRHYLLVCAWCFLIAFAVFAVQILLEMDRDAVLSRIGNGTPGRVDLSWSLVSRVFVYAGIPLLSILATQFPEVGGWLFAWAEPIARGK